MARAAPLPRPDPPDFPGPGQHPHRRDTWVIFPDAQAWNSHRKRIDGLAAPAPCRITGAMPAAPVRPYAQRYWAWQDQAVNA
jgi:hypothetical protein